MDVKALYTLLAIVDHRGFAAAGKAVGLSPSGVSLQMKGLETDLGRALFDRSARPPVLTQDGRLFARRAREAVEVWERLSESLLPEPQSGQLDLGAVPTVVSGILPPALSRLRHLNPDLKIRLTTGLSHELESLLHKGALDAALLAQPEQLGPGLTWLSVCSEPLVVIAPEGAAGKTDRDLLAAAPFIRFTRYAWAGRLIEAELQRRAIVVRPGMEVDSLEGIFSLVAHGLGVSIVPRRTMVAPFPPNVRTLPFGNPVVTRSIGLLQRADSPRGHLVAELTEALVAVSQAVQMADLSE